MAGGGLPNLEGHQSAVQASVLKGSSMGLKVYLSGEIHTDWRDQITEGAADLDVAFPDR